MGILMASERLAGEAILWGGCCSSSVYIGTWRFPVVSYWNAWPTSHQPRHPTSVAKVHMHGIGTPASNNVISSVLTKGRWSSASWFWGQEWPEQSHSEAQFKHEHHPACLIVYVTLIMLGLNSPYEGLDNSHWPKGARIPLSWRIILPSHISKKRGSCW